MDYSKYNYISVNRALGGVGVTVCAWVTKPHWDTLTNSFEGNDEDVYLFGLDVPEEDGPPFAITPIKLYHCTSGQVGLTGGRYVWDDRYWGEVTLEGIQGNITEFEYEPNISVTINNETTPIDPDYEALFLALFNAFDQGAKGKGKERHGNDLTYREQPICTLPKQGHGLGALTYQISKKAGEANTLLDIKGVDAAIREIKGCVNYGAAALIYLEYLKGKEGSND